MDWFVLLQQIRFGLFYILVHGLLSYLTLRMSFRLWQPGQKWLASLYIAMAVILVLDSIGMIAIRYYCIAGLDSHYSYEPQELYKLFQDDIFNFLGKLIICVMSYLHIKPIEDKTSLTEQVENLVPKRIKMPFIKMVLLIFVGSFAYCVICIVIMLFLLLISS